MRTSRLISPRPSARVRPGRELLSRRRSRRAPEGSEGAGRPRVPPGRPCRRRACLARGRRAGRPAHLLRRHRLGRRLEVERRRHPLEADLRRPADGSIGSIAVAPSDPNVVYVGSGEANIRGNVAPGNGIYKSTDAGKTWTHVWKQDGQIGTMVVHPTNPDVAFAAVLGHAFGPNPERGVYRTTRRRQDLAAGPGEGRRHRRLRRRARPVRTRASSSPASGRRAARPGS